MMLLERILSLREDPLVLVLLLISASSCDEPVDPRSADTTAPILQVAFPVDSTAFDANGDGFLDLSVSWSDPGGSGIDVASARVSSLRGVSGSAGPGDNLVTLWQLERSDTNGMALRETLDELLHGGENRLEVSVADRAGNRAVDTVTVRMPHGSLWKTLDTGRTGTFQFGRGVVVCPDDERAYVAAGVNLVVIDTRRVEIVADVRDPWAAEELWFPICVPGDSIVYVTPLVERFNRQTGSWLPNAEPVQTYHGIAASRSNPDHIYVGVPNLGVIAVISRRLNQRVGVIPMPHSSSAREHVICIVPMPHDTKIYMTRLDEGGILVVDPRSGNILHRIKVSGSGWSYPGQVDSMVLDGADQFLYAAVMFGETSGIARIDTRTEQITALLPIVDYVPQSLSLSPSGKRLFLTTYDRRPDLPSQNVLIDVEAWQVIQQFPRNRPTGVIRRDAYSAFRPDGKLVFVARDLKIDVYLNRE